jgi:hypothetical protein
MATRAGSLLATRRGRLTLLLPCAIQFLDIANSSIMNVALPSIPRDLLAAAGIALRATNTHGEPEAQPGQLPASHGVRPAPTQTGQAAPTPAHSHDDHAHQAAVTAAAALTKGVT